MVKVGNYDYSEDVLISAKINKNIRDEMNKLSKKLKLNKGKLIEELYKLILLRNKDGSLNATSGYITMNIFRSPIQK